MNYLLLFSFIITNLVPLTGIHIHKLASVIFLLLCIIHTVMHRKRLQKRTYLLLVIVFLAFFSGLFGMIFEQIPIIMALHKVISIGLVYLLAIHIFIYHRRFKKTK